MKVGVLGSGDVAKVLAAGFLKHGHSVMVGTRDLSKLESWASENSSAQVGSFAEAAAFAEVVVLAVKGTAASSALHLATPENTVSNPSSRPNKGNKAMERTVLSSYQLAQRLGFDVDFRAWEHLLRIHE
jgi:prephenate dehydrogenase